MLGKYTNRNGLRISKELVEFIEREALIGLNLQSETFWSGYAGLLGKLRSKNQALLEKRQFLQSEIDKWNMEHRGKPFDLAAYKSFLQEIGYIVPESGDFKIGTKNVDAELAHQAGPQLVVPILNSRFAINAANARWGSLYDALYGTNAIPHCEELAPSVDYNPLRGAAVEARTADFLDEAIPLADGSHRDVAEYQVSGVNLICQLKSGISTTVLDKRQFLGSAKSASLTTLLFVHNGLHLEIKIDRTHPIGKASTAGVKDVVLEAAVSTIQDFEDSVAAVDAEDKVQAYRNWLGLMKGNLTQKIDKNGKTQLRRLALDREYLGTKRLVLPGRSLMLVRNVGLLVTTDAVLDEDQKETPEGFLDAMVTVLCALHDIQKRDGTRNSRAGSIYIVKPKLHGPDEAALSNELLNYIEDVFGLERHTIKIGIMDEERRTSVNLKETIRAVKDRIVFINTGFLDRTGDEIHTSMQLGPVVPKDQMKHEKWLLAYEDNNVDVGLKTGMAGVAQIGKGMWAQPDNMSAMLHAKGHHPKAGASTAWVPSPTAAVLHAIHYHLDDVSAIQAQIATRPRASLDDILTPPIHLERPLSRQEVKKELSNNCQSILGYVVRWVDAGVGCSKVPDIDNVPLMEDRATLRISAQHLANWLLHGVCSESDVWDALLEMAVEVDHQNRHDPNYRNMSDNPESSLAFRAASELIFKGIDQPNGYTELILQRNRKAAKAQQAQEGVLR